MVGILVPLLACVALAIDGFRWLSAKLQLDNIAEYAALAGLEEYITQADYASYAARLNAAVVKASEAARLNSTIGGVRNGTVHTALHASDSFNAPSGSNSTLVIGYWDRAVSANNFTPAVGGVCIPGPCNAIQITLKMTGFPSLIAGVVHWNMLRATSTTFAYYDDTLAIANRNPYRLGG